MWRELVLVGRYWKDRWWFAELMVRVLGTQWQQMTDLTLAVARTVVKEKRDLAKRFSIETNCCITGQTMAP